jgi:hypothetical protein
VSHRNPTFVSTRYKRIFEKREDEGEQGAVTLLLTLLILWKLMARATAVGKMSDEHDGKVEPPQEVR